MVSCGKELKKPTPFIEQQLMKDIMYDFSLVSAIEGTSAYYTDTVPKINVVSVLNKYGIDSLTYVQNNEYYLNLEDGTYLKMQTEVKERLEEQKVLMDSLVKKENDALQELKNTEDSLVSRVSKLQPLSKGLTKNLKIDSLVPKLD